MFIRVLDCIRADHDSTLVLLALAVAFCAGYTLFSILDHVRMHSGQWKSAWTLAAAFVAGGGIWSTHFIAMLGFNAPVVVTYDIGLTIMSAAFAIAFAAMAVLLLLSTTASALLGSVFLCAAIGTMHFLGMRALSFAGTLEWEPELVALSLCAGGVLVALAATIDRRHTSLVYRFAAGIVFGLAICALHFTAMSAAVFRTDPTVQVAHGSLSEFVLGISVALVTSSIAICSLVIIAFDRRAHNSARLAGQLRSVLEAARTGILVCEGGEIVASNKAFGLMVGQDDIDIAKRPLTDFVRLPSYESPEFHSQEIEAQLTTAGGEPMDVTLHATPIQASAPLQLVVEVRDISIQKREREKMAALANHDALTGLPNRRLLDAELRQETASSREFSLLWIDLDHFKDVNDTHGHAVGDLLLRSVAKRFRSVLNDRHLLARVGGDEFVVLFRPHQRQSDAAEAAESLLRSMASPIQIEDQTLTVSLSIGLASYPLDADSVDALMRRADAALYEAKKTGRSRVILAA